MSDSRFPLVGNLPWLDFVNTEPLRDGVRVDLLGNPDDLLQWLQAAGVIPADAARALARRWSRSAEGRAVFRQAIGLRTALRGAAERLAEGRGVGVEVVRVINRILASRPAVTRLVQTGEGYRSQLEPVSRSPLHPLVPIAESVAQLLERGEESLVRRCEGNQCVLFFYDTTRNRSRRWCSMEGCGARAKAAAYYRRTVKGER